MWVIGVVMKGGGRKAHQGKEEIVLHLLQVLRIL
jgi:hypothetical protein